jgi:hypothetical protein
MNPLLQLVYSKQEYKPWLTRDRKTKTHVRRIERIKSYSCKFSLFTCKLGLIGLVERRLKKKEEEIREEKKRNRLQNPSSSLQPLYLPSYQICIIFFIETNSLDFLLEYLDYAKNEKFVCLLYVLAYFMLCKSLSSCSVLNVLDVNPIPFSP